MGIESNEFTLKLHIFTAVFVFWRVFSKFVSAECEGGGNAPLLIEILLT